MANEYVWEKKLSSVGEGIAKAMSDRAVLNSTRIILVSRILGTKAGRRIQTAAFTSYIRDHGVLAPSLSSAVERAG